MRRSSSLLTWLLLLLLVGGHWGLLQVVAWTGMLIDYSQGNPFVTAVGMTFDGQHPCAICVQIDEGLAADDEDPPQAPGKMHKTAKPDAVLTAITVLPTAPVVTSLPPPHRVDGRPGPDGEPLRRPPRLVG